jgi:hypothetical protein
MFKKSLLTAAVLVALTGGALASADEQCVPKNNMVHILKSPHPNDLVQQWTGESHVGTSSTFIAKRRLSDGLEGGIYLQGDLISPRGGVLNRNIFIIVDEWNCTRVENTSIAPHRALPDAFIGSWCYYKDTGPKEVSTLARIVNGRLPIGCKKDDWGPVRISTEGLDLGEDDDCVIRSVRDARDHPKANGLRHPTLVTAGCRTVDKEPEQAKDTVFLMGLRGDKVHITSVKE